jgi:O-antigen/teichoic acid export membrane protein
LAGSLEARTIGEGRLRGEDVVSVAGVAAPSPSDRRRPRLAGVVASLTAAKVLGAASGFISGPLLARALGASGRGELAAIVVPLTLAPAVLGLGISSYAYRELPRGRAVKDVLGSLGLPLVIIGLLAAACAVPIADALAGGRAVVRTFLIVGLLSMPLLLLAQLLYSSLAGLERWRPLIAATLIPFAVPFVAVVVLYVVGRLTVANAAAATIAGSLLAMCPALSLLTAGRPRFRLPLARKGLDFGLKSWLGGLAQLANARLDQLLMITVVSSRELGLYAVATTLSGASSLATGALAPPLMTRVASGETRLMADAVRVALAGTLVLNVALALITPVLLTVLFGPEFSHAVPTAIVLLAANVPLSAGAVLSSALQADGAPVIPSVGEGIALIITVVGLIALLKPLGGLGAALVSLAAYSASFIYQLVMARRRVRVPIHRFVVPRRADLRWAAALVKLAISRFRTAL